MRILEAKCEVSSLGDKDGEIAYDIMRAFFKYLNDFIKAIMLIAINY